SEEHTSELQSLTNLVCRLLLEKKKATRTLGTNPPDVLALSTATGALGGLFASRLNHQLRAVRVFTSGLLSGVSVSNRNDVVKVHTICSQVADSVHAPGLAHPLHARSEFSCRSATVFLTAPESSHAKEPLLHALPASLELFFLMAAASAALSLFSPPLPFSA